MDEEEIPFEVILLDFPGDVIKIDGICYEFVDVTFDPPTHDVPGDVYDTCEDCEQESSSAGSSGSGSSSSKAG